MPSQASAMPYAAQRRHSYAAQWAKIAQRTSAEVCVIVPTSTSPSATWHAGAAFYFTMQRAIANLQHPII